jgi:transposase
MIGTNLESPGLVMHLRVSTKKRNGQTYRYVQFVESYRRGDGVPAHKVVASLGKLSDQEICNLRLALKASREGKALILPDVEQAEHWRARVIANLRYLDVAVVQEMWRRWKLPDLFNRLIPQKHEAIAPSAVIAALVAHRCTDPGSKLYAQRWFPRTALPELLHVPVEQFGNTRIHRVLDSLDRIDSALQADLADRYQRKEGVFATLFMDVTDAWFAGRGPEMAERNRTKEGLRNKHKVGIVLVCNEHGYPLRWQVVPGKRREPLCMQEMLSLIQDEAWLGDIPLVCDRAMGQAGSVAKLVESGVRFLTASCRPEISSYTDAIPYEAFLKLSPIGSEITRKGEMETAARLAEEVGLKKVDDLLYVHDLGVCERKLLFDRPKNEYSGATWDPDELEGGASFIALARIFQDRLNKKEFRSKSELAEKEGLTRARVTQVMNTIKIDRELQERILRGEFGYVSERLLRDCVKLDTEVAQRELLEENAKIMRPRRDSNVLKPPRRMGRQSVKLRLVAYFNPQMFVEQRASLSQRRKRVEDFVENLNSQLCLHDSRREKENVHRQVLRELGRWKLISAFDVRVVTKRDRKAERSHLRVDLRLNEEQWKRRLRFAGFVLLVGHPDLPHDGEEIVRLYREKDTVEKDFQTIKDVVKLRPLYHHTDAKVRAHVTLCMLALLIERSIERRLKRSGMATTAAACFEELRECHLNQVESELADEPTYAMTDPTQEQLAILRSLRMKSLIDPEEVAERLTPRRAG